MHEVFEERRGTSCLYLYDHKTGDVLKKGLSNCMHSAEHLFFGIF